MTVAMLKREVIMTKREGARARHLEAVSEPEDPSAKASIRSELSLTHIHAGVYSW
jgi:hypothetical protein